MKYIKITSELKDLTKDAIYETHNHVYSLDMKTVVDDSGYYRTIYSKDYEIMEE